MAGGNDRVELDSDSEEEDANQPSEYGRDDVVLLSSDSDEGESDSATPLCILRYVPGVSPS